MKLIRTAYLRTGIFGELRDDVGARLFFTIEHAYPYVMGSVDTVYSPKIPPGRYTCVKGIHQLAGGMPFETFEITGVEGHTGLLFHPGNSNADSSGCVLIGTARGNDPVSGAPIITQSRAAFAAFMNQFQGFAAFPIDVS